MKYILSLCCLLSFAVLSCKDNINDLPNGYINPPIFYFSILDRSGTPLITSQNTVIKAYSVSGIEKTYYSDLEIYPVPVPNNFFVTTRNLATASSEANIKTFYLEMNGDVDTLMLDIQRLPVATADDGGYAYRKVTFNGKTAATYPSVGYVPEFYLLKK